MSRDVLARLERALERFDEVHDRIAQLEVRNASFMIEGPVMERDHEKGVRVQIAMAGDGKPVLSDWFQPGDRSGASRYVPEKGEQLRVLFIGGDLSQPLSIPATHSDAKPNPAAALDEVVHHNRDGRRHSTEKGHVKDGVEGTKTSFVGQDPGEEKKGDNFPHELQRQLQGVRAELSQHGHHIAAMHDVTSKLREIAEKKIPELMQLKPFLDGKPQDLERAAKQVEGKLKGYIGKQLMQQLEKLTSGLGLLSGAADLVQSLAEGDVSAILDQAADLAAQNGVDIGGALDTARGLVGAAAGGGNPAAMLGAMGQMAAAFAGSPAAAAFGLLQGQMGGLLGLAAKIAASMGDMVDGQKNLTKGETKSTRVGGYAKKPPRKVPPPGTKPNNDAGVGGGAVVA